MTPSMDRLVLALAATCCVWATGCASSSAGDRPVPATAAGRALAGFESRFDTLKLGMTRQDVDDHMGRRPTIRGADRWTWEIGDEDTARKHVFWVSFAAGQFVAKGSSIRAED